MKRNTSALAIVLLLALAYAALHSGITRADDDTPPWDHTFKGHEMWITSLDDGMAKAAAQHRNVLIDLYSRG